jgi:hypothetical protein
MDRQIVIEKTLKYLNLLPENKAEEVLDYIEYLFNKNEDSFLTKGISQLAAQSKSFDFLNEEEDIYTLDDVKERYQ